MIEEILKAHLSDYVFIRIPSRLNDKIGSFHLSLSPKLIQDNFTPDDEVGDKPLNEEQHIRTAGIVIAAPERLNPINLYENYLGTPRYSPHVTHEIIKDAIMRMPDKLKKNYGRNMYNPGNPPESFQQQPNNPEIKVGDKIYFEYNVLLNDDAFVGSDDDGEVYKVPYQSIYCYVRDEKINMINGWVFVESVTKEQSSKYIVFVNNKPQQNVGKIAHIGKWLDTFVPPEGDEALFIRPLFSTKEFEYLADNHTISGYEVEGKQYYPLRNWDIVAVNVDGEWVTTDDFVKIEPEVMKTIGSVETIEFKKDQHQPFKPGQIFVPQGSVTHEKKNRIFKFGIGKNAATGERLAYGKSSLYLFLNDENVLFIHRSDCWGTFVNG